MSDQFFGIQGLNRINMGLFQNNHEILLKILLLRNNHNEMSFILDG